MRDIWSLCVWKRQLHLQWDFNVSEHNRVLAGVLPCSSVYYCCSIPSALATRGIASQYAGG